MTVTFYDNKQDLFKAMREAHNQEQQEFDALLRPKTQLQALSNYLAPIFKGAANGIKVEIFDGEGNNFLKNNSNEKMAAFVQITTKKGTNIVGITDEMLEDASFNWKRERKTNNMIVQALCVIALSQYPLAHLFIKDIADKCLKLNDAMSLFAILD